jgi:Rad3-related DNA helicase
MANVLPLVLAFLLHNHLLSHNLIFFVDGQRSLYTAILTAFTWLPSFQVILDWYHLEKRCKEQLSLALKGRVIRNSLLEQLLPCLWHGCVDRALALLQTVDPDQIRNQDALETLMGYLERNRPYLPCYAVRKQLRLRNSSNLGEKANDLVVSDRQKHNGMSWSKPGSTALAAVTALVRNQEYKRWFQTGSLSFSFSPVC